MIPKFRAWDKVENKMISTDDIVCFSYEDNTITVQKIYFESGLPVERDLNEYYFDDVILMRSIGIFDEIGIEIFEGDIVNAYDIETNDFEEFKITSLTGVVTYHKNAFALEKENVFNDLWVCAEHYKVIGNIYENPDLIESVEE